MVFVIRHAELWGFTFRCITYGPIRGNQLNELATLPSNSCTFLCYNKTLPIWYRFWITESLFISPHHIPRDHPLYPDGRRPVLFPVHPLQCNVPQLQAAPLHSVVLARNMLHTHDWHLKPSVLLELHVWWSASCSYITHLSHLHQCCLAYNRIWQACYTVTLYWVLFRPEPWRCIKMAKVKCTNFFWSSWNDINDRAIRNLTSWTSPNHLTHKPLHYFTLAVFPHKSCWCLHFPLLAINLSQYCQYYTVMKVYMAEACATYDNRRMLLKFGKETWKENHWARHTAASKRTDWSGSEYGFCQHGDELLNFHKSKRFLEQLNSYPSIEGRLCHEVTWLTIKLP